MHTRGTSSVEDIDEAGQLLLSNFIFVFHSVIKEKKRTELWHYIIQTQQKKKI